MLKKIFRALFARSAAVLAKQPDAAKYPGIPEVADGNTAVILVEREAADASGAYATAPTTAMTDFWEASVREGHLNAFDRPLIHVRPDSEHAAAGIAAGMAMSGLRASNFSAGPGMAFMHESLYAAVGKRLPYVVNMGCRAVSKASLSVHAGHDDYHAIDDTGCIQMLARSAQEAADLSLIARKLAELSLTPAIVGQDGLATTHGIESLRLPERELVAEYLGSPDDLIETPTAAQKMLYGPQRRRVPSLWDVDLPLVSGTVQNQDAYMQATIAQRPYFFDHIEPLAARCMDEYAGLTGRRYAPVGQHRTGDADYLIVGMGSLVVQAEAVADYLRDRRGIRVGVVNITLFRPFPGQVLSELLKGRKGVVVLERTDQPLAEDLPLMREVRAVVAKCMENAVCGEDFVHAGYPAYRQAGDMPPLFSGCYGLGSRDLQPQALIAAVENMLPEGKQRRFFYLSVDFVRRKGDGQPDAAGQKLLAAYPDIESLGLPAGEDPNLLPDDAVAIRLHFPGGSGAVSAGKELAGTIARLTGWCVKGNAQRESEMTAQPGSYQIAVASQPIRIDCEYLEVDVVMSSDPCVQSHSDPFTGLKGGGVLIVQSALPTPAAVWDSFPVREQSEIIDNDYQLFYLDALKIAREETGNADLLPQIEGCVFQGAFFAATAFLADRGISEADFFKGIGEQLQARFGPGELAERSLRAMQRGFFELTEIGQKTIGFGRKTGAGKPATVPVLLHHLPGHAPTHHHPPSSDVRRFWEQTGSYYASRGDSDNVVDPFISHSVMPAATGIFRDMTGVRLEHPEWLAERCTGCGDCYMACPDAAIPGLVNSPGEVIDTVIARAGAGGQALVRLQRAARRLEKEVGQRLGAAGGAVAPALKGALQALLERADEADKDALAAEIAAFEEKLGEFKLATTATYWSEREARAAGSGGLFSLTVNPNACKGCGVCVSVCPEGALQTVPQTRDSVAQLRRHWELWLHLPNTSPEFRQAGGAAAPSFALPALMLDKRTFGAMDGVDGACRGCGEKTALHLFTATVAALMQPRAEAFVTRIEGLIGQLEKRAGMMLTAPVDVTDTRALLKAVDELSGQSATLADISQSIGSGGVPINAPGLKRIVALLDSLKDLRRRYLGGPQGKGRCHMGAVNATGCTSMWGATFPYNPYPFPWTSHLFQDSTSVALGIFEGHMVKMADAFKAVRRAELELAGAYEGERGAGHDEFLRRFDWHQFGEDEWALCPPVVATGGIDAMVENGFQNLSRALMSGKPIKVLVLDTQDRSNVAAQRSESIGATLAGRAGMATTRKEISLLATAHRSAFVLQSTVAHTAHLVQGFVDGLNARRPALFNIYAACPPKHGVGDARQVLQSRLAVEARAFPLFRYDPDAGVSFSEAVSMAGNPALERDWPTYTLRHVDDSGVERTLELAMTFADFAATEGRFASHFKVASPETWNDSMLPLPEYLRTEVEAREGLHPYVWSLNERRQLVRLMVSEELAALSEDRLVFWNQIKQMAGLASEQNSPALIRERIRGELLERILTELGSPLGTSAVVTGPAPAASVPVAAAPAGGNGADGVQIDSAECSACDECVQLAPGAFGYNDQKQAIVVNPQGARFADLVKAAEKCNAGCIRPGAPWNPAEADLAKWVARAERFN